MGCGSTKVKSKDDMVISDEELLGLYLEFLEKYPSGYASKEDIKKVYHKQFPHGDCTEFTEHAFRMLDVDNDGVVDFREFIVVLSMATSDDKDMKLRLAFSLYDIDGNGSISRDEMQQVLKALKKMGSKEQESEQEMEAWAKQRTNDVFTIMDIDGDNSISIQEFICTGEVVELLNLLPLAPPVFI